MHSERCSNARQQSHDCQFALRNFRTHTDSAQPRIQTLNPDPLLLLGVGSGHETNNYPAQTTPGCACVINCITCAIDLYARPTRATPSQPTDSTLCQNCTLALPRLRVFSAVYAEARGMVSPYPSLTLGEATSATALD